MTCDDGSWNPALAINSATGVISGTPKDGDVGTCTIKVVASALSTSIFQIFNVTVVNTDEPFATTLSSIEPANTDATSFSVTITFANSVTGLTLGEITVGNGTASNLAGSGTTYTVDITPTAPGTVSVDVAAGVAGDSNGNSNSAATQLTRNHRTNKIRFDSSTASEQLGLIYAGMVDLNIDGKQDLVMLGAVVGGVRTVYVLFGQADRDAYSVTQNIPTLNGTNGVRFLVGSAGNVSAKVHDANGDGNLDISISTNGINCVEPGTAYTVYAAAGVWRLV